MEWVLCTCKFRLTRPNINKQTTSFKFALISVYKFRQYFLQPLMVSANQITKKSFLAYTSPALSHMSQNLIIINIIIVLNLTYVLQNKLRDDNICCILKFVF